MKNFAHLAGVYAAAVTPLLPDFSPSLDDVPRLLAFLHRRGCHGALLFGTTGEGPSFSPAERLAVLQVALDNRELYPGFRILAGTSTPSLEETIDLTTAAFDLGVDGVLVLPPYYYRQVSDDGLFVWYSHVLRRAVPTGSPLLAYHIPRLTGVPLSLDLLERLLEAHPQRFAGLKDSSGEADHARDLGERFGQDLLVLNGTDSLFSLALQNFAQGCITALGNLFSPDLRQMWDAYQQGLASPDAHARLLTARAISDRYQPAPPLLKALLAHRHGLPRWAVRPPLLPLTPEAEEKVLAEIAVLTEPGLA